MLSFTRFKKVAPAERDYKIADEKGLYQLVRPSGGKLWRLKYRIAGKERLLSYGPYPEIGLADARDMRDAACKLIVQGIDPAQEKKRQAHAD